MPSRPPRSHEPRHRAAGNFCLLTALSIDDVLARLAEAGIAVVEGPAERSGATGPIVSVYFTDPDGNLVEVSSLL